MRTSFYFKSALVILCLSISAEAKLLGQALSAGRYYGEASPPYFLTDLELKTDGTFVLIISGQHSGVRGTGDWKMVADSLQLTFDEESLKSPDPSQVFTSSWSLLESKPSNSPAISFLVLDREVNGAIPDAKISVPVNESDYHIYTNVEGKAQLSIESNSMPAVIRVGLIGYTEVEISTAGMESNRSEIEVLLVPSWFEGSREPISTSKKWILGASVLANGDLFLASSDSSNTILFRN